MAIERALLDNKQEDIHLLQSLVLRLQETQEVQFELELQGGVHSLHDSRSFLDVSEVSQLLNDAVVTKIATSLYKIR